LEVEELISVGVAVGTVQVDLGLFHLEGRERLWVADVHQSQGRVV